MSDFPWFLISWQMLPILFSCLFEKSVPRLKWLRCFSLQGTTTGKNAVIEFEKLMIIQYNLKWNLQIPEKRCNLTNLQSLWKCKVFSIQRYSVYNSSAVPHGKYLHPSWITGPAESTVNFIRSPGLTHCHFCEFLSETEADWPDLCYHIAAQWLSRGKVL